MKVKEFNLRERAEIVSLAMQCSESLKSQELIDYFINTISEKTNNESGDINKIIDVKYPKSSKIFRDDIKYIILQYILQNTEKNFLLECFRDFFIFHNEANKNTVSVDKYFDEWYSNRKK